MSQHLGEKLTFFISSESNNPNFISGTASNFDYKIELPRPNNFNSVVVLQATIPKTYYQITDKTGNFTLTEGKDSVTVSLDAGYYSKRSLSTILPTKLNDASPNGWTYSVSYPNSHTEVCTEKYTFTVSGHSSQPSFTFGKKTEFAHELMGFNAQSTYDFTADSLTSANVVNFQPTTAILLKSDLVHSHDGVLQEIFSGSDRFMTDIRYQATNIPFNSKPVSSNNSGRFHFVITDTEGNEINTNGNSIHFSLCFYQRDDHNEHSRRFLALQALKETK